MAVLGSSFDALQMVLYIKCVQRFFKLFNVKHMSCGKKYFKYVFYNLMELLIIFRIIMNMSTIVVWMVIIFGEISAERCYFFTTSWIGAKLYIAGYVNTFTPNYAAMIILYVLNFFGT